MYVYINEVSPSPHISFPVFDLLNQEEKHDGQLRGFHLFQTDIFSHRWQVVYQHCASVILRYFSKYIGGCYVSSAGLL